MWNLVVGGNYRVRPALCSRIQASKLTFCGNGCKEQREWLAILPVKCSGVDACISLILRLRANLKLAVKLVRLTSDDH